MSAVHEKLVKCHWCRYPARGRCDAPSPRVPDKPCGRVFCGCHGAYKGRGQDYCQDCMTLAQKQENERGPG